MYRPRIISMVFRRILYQVVSVFAKKSYGSAKQRLMPDDSADSSDSDDTPPPTPAVLHYCPKAYAILAGEPYDAHDAPAPSRPSQGRPRSAVQNHGGVDERLTSVFGTRERSVSVLAREAYRAHYRQAQLLGAWLQDQITGARAGASVRFCPASRPRFAGCAAMGHGAWVLLEDIPAGRVSVAPLDRSLLEHLADGSKRIWIHEEDMRLVPDHPLTRVFRANDECYAATYGVPLHGEEEARWDAEYPGSGPGGLHAKSLPHRRSIWSDCGSLPRADEEADAWATGPDSPGTEWHAVPNVPEELTPDWSTDFHFDAEPISYDELHFTPTIPPVQETSWLNPPWLAPSQATPSLEPYGQEPTHWDTTTVSPSWQVNYSLVPRTAGYAANELAQSQPAPPCIWPAGPEAACCGTGPSRDARYNYEEETPEEWDAGRSWILVP
jgi:hypothetical protein